MSVNKYWPGSLTWPEIVERVRSWSDGPITRDEAYEVMHVASLLGVFGFPEGSQFREEKQVSARDTQFAGFAKGVWNEVTTLFESLEKEHVIDDGCIMCNWTPEQIAQLVEPLIAHRAYDLVEHACEDAAFKQTGSRASVSSMLSYITDLPWPTEETK